MIVIDTHALVWLFEGDPQLGRKARQKIHEERAGKGVYIPAVSIWETAMLVNKAKLVLSRSVREWFDAVLLSPGFHLAQINVAIGIDAGSLPGNIHGDPADRLIVATARSLGCSVLTVDRKILDYAEEGHVQAINASL